MAKTVALLKVAVHYCDYSLPFKGKVKQGYVHYSSLLQIPPS